jgi:hypothetical protein
MKPVLIILIILHGSVHALGFLKAYNIVPVNQLTQPISRLNGTLWFFTGLFFISASVLFSFQQQWWWMLAFPAIILSEYLIINDWPDAKFGTVMNVIIFIATILGFIAWWLSKH